MRDVSFGKKEDNKTVHTSSLDTRTRIIFNSINLIKKIELMKTLVNSTM